MDNQKVARFNSQPLRERIYCSTTSVDEGEWFSQYHLPLLSYLGVTFPNMSKGYSLPLSQEVKAHEAKVMSGRGISFPGIAQSHNQLNNLKNSSSSIILIPFARA